MLHDMSLTQKYAVVYDLPCRLDIPMAMEGRFPFSWQPGTGSRVGLLPREGEANDIVWVDVPEKYVFHPMNAYDAEDGTVVIDLCVYDRMFDHHRIGPFEDNLPRLERWVVNPATRTSSTTVIDDTPQEFPRHRGRLTAKPYRYGYTVSPSTARSEWPTIKHDLHTGERWVFDHGVGRGAGESVFIGREGATDEDDGWLMTFVHDVPNETAELVILDAQDFDRGEVARVKLPQRVPYGFHGNWVSDRSVPPKTS
jgi:carotenoid cleavage dioxygenase